jgi:tartrate-resistant acid phosphatase type 5
MKQTRRQFVRTLFVASAQAAVIGSLMPRDLFAADAPSGGLNFLVFGDWGRNGEKDQLAVAAQMAAAAKDLEAKFIISVGDNFYEDGVASVDDPQWQASFEKVYAAPPLQVPWHVVFGNHDYHGDCDAQIAYHQVSPRWNLPARYYTRTERLDSGGPAEFFFLDTTPMAKLDDDEAAFHGNVNSQHVPAQVAWLDAALAASTAPWKIVVAHHPVYSGGPHGDTPYIIEHILPLLEKHQVQVYFNGHDHDLQHLQAGKVNLFCSGAGSKPRETKNTPHTRFAKGCSGFITVALQADQMDVRMIDDHGRLLYTATVPRVSV